MPIRKALRDRLNDRNSVLWCELQMASVTWSVYLVDRWCRELRFDMRDCVGLTDYHSCTVLVAWELTDEFAESVLVHEVTGHALVYAYGVALRPGEDCSTKQEEQVVNPYTSNLYDALSRNGWLSLPPRPDLPKHARRP